MSIPSNAPQSATSASQPLQQQKKHRSARLIFFVVFSWTALVGGITFLIIVLLNALIYPETRAGNSYFSEQIEQSGYSSIMEFEYECYGALPLQESSCYGDVTINSDDIAEVEAARDFANGLMYNPRLADVLPRDEISPPSIDIIYQGVDFPLSNDLDIATFDYMIEWTEREGITAKEVYITDRFYGSSAQDPPQGNEIFITGSVMPAFGDGCAATKKLFDEGYLRVSMMTDDESGWLIRKFPVELGDR